MRAVQCEKESSLGLCPQAEDAIGTVDLTTVEDMANSAAEQDNFEKL